MKKRVLTKYDLKDYGLVLFGSAILAVGYSLFIVPHNIVPGGVFGLSIVINQLTRLPVGMIALAINIPLLIWGIKILGIRTGIKTAFSMVTVSFFIDMITYSTKGKVIVDDILVSSIFGGIMIALAIAIVMRANATTGGNDIFVRIIGKKIKMPFSQLILIVDGAIVLIGVIVFSDFTLAAYCIIAIFSISKTIDYLMKRASGNKTLLVFSERNESIRKAVSSDLNLGKNIVEMIHQDSNEKMIIVAKNNRKLDQIKAIIDGIDDKAYVISVESNNIK